MIAASQSNWFENLSALFSNKLSREEKEFEQSMEGLYGYFQEKSQGRCLSKKLFLTAQREGMIKELFALYNSEHTAQKLCESRFLRKMAKHDKQNDSHIDFISKVYAPSMIKRMADSNALLQDSLFADWLTHFNATIMDPETLSKQKAVMNSMPKEFLDKLTAGRTEIGKKLMGAKANGWINASKIEMIVAGISDKASISSNQEELSSSNVVNYFTSEYLKLIHSGGEHSEAYRQSLVVGLNNLKNDPTMPKN